MSEHQLEDHEEPTYTQMKMRSDRGAKRQKRADSNGEYGAMFEFDRSLDYENELNEGSYGNPDSMLRNTDGLTMQRQVSIDDI